MWIPDAVLEHVRAVTEEPDLAGTKYVLGRVLGKGGMGVVYAARDTELEREVALKVCAAASPDTRPEARVLARLEHPGIVPVHDVGTLPDGRTFYVMKLVHGERLDRWLTRQHELPAALRLFQRVCEAVAFAHANGVLHRDLKPENVMVGAFGEALVMDWGLAEAPAGAIVGTKDFMSPEQARGDPVDARTDVYALGAILRVLLGEAAPKPLASIAAKSCAPEPSSRYDGALALSDDVGRWLDGQPVHAHAETLLERASRVASRHRVLLSLFGVYLLVRVALALFLR
jgi:serine/threonine protein kinase